jgi:hypothetical protein
LGENILPIFYVNPARKRATKKRKNPVKGSIRRVSSSSTKAKKPLKKNPAARKPAKTKPKQGKKKMANKRSKASYRKAALKGARTRKRGATKRRAKRNPPKNPKRVAAGKKGAAAKKRKAAAKRYHSGAQSYAKGIAKRKKRKATKRKTTAKRKTKRSAASYRKAALKGARTRKRNARGRGASVVRKRKRTRKQANRYASYGLKGVKKSGRKIVRAQKRKGAWRTRRHLAKKGMMHVKNPGGMMSAMKQVLPVAGSFYISRLAANKLGDVPALGGVLSRLQVGGYDLSKPVVSGVILAAVNYGTKKGKLSKHRSALMIGTALAFVDSLIAAFAPPDVKSMIGVGEYVPTSEYVASGEYVSTGDYVQEHGAALMEDPHGLYAVDGLHEVHAIHGIEPPGACRRFGSGYTPDPPLSE